MMAVWQTQTLILIPLLTAHIIWIFPHGSYGVSVSCRWHKVSSPTSNVSIECQSDPQESTLKCDLCPLLVPFLDPAAHVSPTECSHTNVSFSELTDGHDCKLLCPGHMPEHVPLSCILQEVYPPPTCLIPNQDLDKNIHCNWTWSSNPLIPTDFTLHWTDVDDDPRYSGSINVGQKDRGIIPRDKYPSHGDIKVWVSAANILGKIDSETLITNTESISQPAPPSITHHDASEALEIFWNYKDQGYLSNQWPCKVQYKKQCDQAWTEVEDTFDTSFLLDEAEPFTTYNFRIRCRHVSDERPVMSDWSSEYTAKSPAAAPTGTLDVWCDCDSTSDECTILWKELPKQQARGNINSYEVSMKLSNGSVLNITESAYTSAETCAQCRMDKSLNLDPQAQQSYVTCPQEQEQSCFHYCHLSVSVKQVTGIGVTADAAGGKSSPAHVALPRTDLQQPAISLEVRGKSQELNVSWSVQPPFSDSLQEYVVQHKPVGLPHSPCLNWVKVHKTQTFVKLTGQLSNYTAYNVSLFAIVNNSSCLLKSVIAYTVEGVPPEVTDFQAVPTSPTSANLTWTPIPLNISQGRILLYQVGFSHDAVVYNVSSNQSSLQVNNLYPGQQYVVWITAVTSAGEGKNATSYFTTSSPGNITAAVVGIVIIVFIVPLALFILVLWWCSRGKGTRWFYKIPDPINSSSFKQMSNQFWHSWPVTSSSMEYGLTISQIEVIPEPEVEHEPEMEQPEEHREQEQSRGKELQRLGVLERNNSMLQHQKEYSQMIDTSDEEGREDEDSEWDEEPFPSDYEKHFLPITVDA